VELRARLADFGDDPAIVWGDREHSYGELVASIDAALDLLRDEGVPPGSVVALVADFAPASIAMALALWERGCVLVPLAAGTAGGEAGLLEIAEVECVVSSGAGGAAALRRTGTVARHPSLRALADAGRPGLVLFSSGTSGTAKAALHDAARLLARYAAARRARRMLAFLLFDHIGGVNTMLHSLMYGGCLVTVADRAPDAVGAAIERHRVEVLPTSPTFLNLFLLARADERYDLSSLRLVTYGTEPMPELTLRTLHARLPGVRLQQTYGTTELGILSSRSRGSDSVWMQLGGEDADLRVRDGKLEVRAAAAMLGYLNAPEAFTDDGWYATGDVVELDGGWIRVLGRPGELINVGGQKVVPTDVEGVLEAMEGVEEAVVSGEESPLVGQIVRATVQLAADEPAAEFRRRMREYCRDRLPRHMIPQKVVLADRPLRSARYKKLRSP
jgi:acyl-coenzyme A synthetase/AMP-(fatty) acid ligase